MDKHSASGSDVLEVDGNVVTLTICIERNVGELSILVAERDTPLTVVITRFGFCEQWDRGHLNDRCSPNPSPASDSPTIDSVSLTARGSTGGATTTVHVHDIESASTRRINFSIKGLSANTGESDDVFGCVRMVEALAAGIKSNAIHLANGSAVIQSKTDYLECSGEVAIFNTEAEFARLLPQSQLWANQSNLRKFEFARGSVFSVPHSELSPLTWHTHKQLSLSIGSIESRHAAVGSGLVSERVTPTVGDLNRPKLLITGYVASAEIRAEISWATTKTACIFELSKGAALRHCELHGLLLELNPQSSILDCSGTVAFSKCRDAYITGGDAPLQLKPYVNKDRESGQDIFKGSTLDKVHIPIDEGAMPLILSLQNAAIVNPVAPSKQTLRGGNCEQQRYAIEVLNRIVSKQSAYGSLRCKWGYLAAVSRKVGTHNSSERCALTALQAFGFGFRPLWAFLLWLGFVILSAVSLHIYSGGSNSVADAISDIADRATSVAVEPANFFKVAPETPDPELGIKGRRRIVLRVVSAALLGNFILAFSRYTRSSAK